MAKPISKAQLKAIRVYFDADGGTSSRLVRLDTHCALMKRGLLEVADKGELRTVYHTYGYNFGRIRITQGRLESTARFRLTDAGRAVATAQGGQH